MKAATALVAILLSCAMAAISSLLASLTGLDRASIEVGILAYIVFRHVPWDADE